MYGNSPREGALLAAGDVMPTCSSWCRMSLVGDAVVSFPFPLRSTGFDTLLTTGEATGMIPSSSSLSSSETSTTVLRYAVGAEEEATGGGLGELEEYLTGRLARGGGRGEE